MRTKMKVFKSVLFVLTLLVSSTIADRKLDAEINPGCPKDDRCLASKLSYVRADGDNDTVHFLFDFSLKPSLIVLKTSKDAIIQVNYTGELSGSVSTIKFSETPSYMFGSVFNYLYEFNDVNDTALMDNGENFIKMDSKQFKWEMTKLQNEFNETVEVTISASSYRAPGITKTGNVSITLKVYGKKDMGPKLPHLFHTPESGELTLILDHLKTNFNKSRFAVELLTISSYPYNKSEEITVNTFSDDKLSGGTFSTYLVDARGEGKKEGGGYLSWKPVMYKAPDTHSLNSSSTHQYGIRDHSYEHDWINTALYYLYANTLFSDSSRYLKKAVNVSFGQPNDEFYDKSNYLYWTFLVGIGAPPNSEVGFLEMSLIASLLLMLSITMILIFCIFMRWMSSKRNSIIYGQ